MSDAEAERLLRLAIETAPGGFLLMDEQGTIAVTNQQLERLFGYGPGELIGRSVDLLLPDKVRDLHAGHEQGFKHAPERRRMGADGDLWGVRRDGSRFPVEVDLNPFETRNGLFVMASVVDVALRREVGEASRLQVESQLELERLVAELSTKFINLPPEQVDEVILQALGRIGETLDLDRCTFFRITPDGVATDAQGWQRTGIPPAPAPVAVPERVPWAYATLRAGEVVSFSSTSEIPNPIDRETFRSIGTKSAVTVPLSVAGRLVGAVGVNMVREERVWTPEVVHRLRIFATAFGNVLARRASDEALQQALAEVERLRDRLQAENVYLRREVGERLGTGIIVGESSAIGRVLEQVRQVASTDATVLLLGETGTGKELFATQVHELSARRARTMVRVNCSAIPSTLIESELFGREKGAFTGALSRQIGRFELADHSTIFLDEIGDLPAEIQVKLLRVLEERQIERLGSPTSIHVDTRIIAATHRNLEERIDAGQFREDLFYRLNVFPIHVPPLRERVEDIPLLVWRFVEEFARTFGKRVEAIPKENMEALQHYAWPGNIRELRNVVERAMITSAGTRLTIPLPAPSVAAARRSAKLVDVEREHLLNVLEATGWRIRGAAGAADRLGIKPTTLETRMVKLGLKRPRPPEA